jgi:hypothetical protein
VVLARRPGRPVACIYISSLYHLMFVRNIHVLSCTNAHTHKSVMDQITSKGVGWKLSRKSLEFGNLDGLSEWKKEKEDHEILCYTTYNTHTGLEVGLLFPISRMLQFLTVATCAICIVFDCINAIVCWRAIASFRHARSHKTTHGCFLLMEVVRLCILYQLILL